MPIIAGAIALIGAVFGIVSGYLTIAEKWEAHKERRAKKKAEKDALNG